MKPQPQYQNTRNTPVISLEKGKIPPQAVDLEEAVLGVALTFSRSIGEIVELFINEQVFYKMAHQEIYNAMLEMFKNNEPVDLLTVVNKLRERKKLDAVGGEYALIQLTQKVSSDSHLEYHCRIILQMFVKRKSITVANEILRRSYQDETDIFDLLARFQQEIDNIAQWLIRKKPTDFKTVVDQFFNRAKNDIPGVPNSLTDLQYKMNGYRDQDLIIIAARPGMGKTALILNEAKHQAKQGIPVGIFSLEMSANDLVGRMIADECEIDYSRIHKNKLDPFEKRLMEEKRAEFEKLPVHIHDQAGLTPMELKIQASRWKREHGVKIIYVDYLQLMMAAGKENNGNREQEISSISRSLKGTAKDLEIPVVALSQLSRAVESRGGMKRPMLSDLRESGAIEQDADIVMFLLRPEYYHIDTWDDEDNSPTKGQCEINFAKFRGGELGACISGCDLKYMRFFDLDEKDAFFDNIPPPLQDPSEVFDSPGTDDQDDLPF